MINENSQVIDLYCDEEMVPSSVEDEGNSEFSMEGSRKRRKLSALESESDPDESVEAEELKHSLHKYMSRRYGRTTHLPPRGSPESVMDLCLQSSSLSAIRSTNALKLEITDDDLSSVSDGEESHAARTRHFRPYTSRRSGRGFMSVRRRAYPNHLSRVTDVQKINLNYEDKCTCCLNIKTHDQSSSSITFDVRKNKCADGSSSESDDDSTDLGTSVANTLRTANVVRQRSILCCGMNGTCDPNCEESVVASIKEDKPERCGNLILRASKQPEGIENASECPICYRGFLEQNIGTPASCSHNFCSECLQMWARNVNTCPLDRTVFNMIYVRKRLYGNVIEQIPVENRDLDTGEETDSDASFCEVCGRNSLQERLIVCDCCGRMYHLACISPPVTNVPVSDWYCSDCSRFE